MANKTIISISLSENYRDDDRDEYSDPDDEMIVNTLTIEFSDGSSSKFKDMWQGCCERRYMHTDDDLEYFKGSELLHVKLQDGPTAKQNEYGNIIDSQFLIITTTKGSFTIVNYNDHNGYYGGFRIECLD